MPRFHRRLLCLCAALPVLLGSPLAQAARGPVLNCSVTVTYQHTQAGTVFGTETYSQSFAVQENAPFFEDFSTATRQKSFGASARTTGGIATVYFAFFADVGVFSAVSFSNQASETGGAINSSGQLGYATSLGIAGNHDTQYQLNCKRR
jgi:predicted outer membrane repeat protein